MAALRRFTKMHGIGNDFVVFDATRETLDLSPQQVRFLADRRFGVGCDQVLLVEAPKQPGTDFYYRIFNADGGEVEQCGNGARCFARFVREHGLATRDEIDVGTRAGTIRLFLEPDGQVRVNMGTPRLDPPQIPFVAEAIAASYDLEVDGRTYPIAAVSMGNPHAVLQVPSVADAPVGNLGPAIQRHPRFPMGVNVGFMQVADGARIRLRVYERGSGETLACGTGACAAVVAGRIQGLLDERVRVTLPGGELIIAWAGAGQPVWMTGPAVFVYEGEITL